MTQNWKNDILDCEDCSVETLRVPEWDKTVYVRPLNGDERDEYDRIVCDKKFPDEGEPDWRGIRACLVAMGLCDEEGNSLNFTELEIVRLGKKNGKAINRLFEKIRDISGLRFDADEDAEKNLPEDQSENSG